MLADILILRPDSSRDQILTYDLGTTGGNTQPGALVIVPLQNRMERGLVLKLTELAPEAKTIRKISKIVSNEPLLSAQGLQLAAWLSAYYACSLNKTLQLFIPPPLRLTERRKIFINSELTQSEITQENLFFSETENDILEAVKKRPGLNRTTLSKKFGPDGRTALEALLAKQILREETSFLEHRAKITDLTKTLDGLPATRPQEMNAEQKTAAQKICTSLARRTAGKWLLYGITGSGKTEVYFQAIEKALSLGRQALFLVPEIALTSMMISLLLESFGSRAALLHSAMTPSARASEWQRIKKGEARVILGPRSALFAPFSDLGLIILDEEHENTYKQSEPDPRYDARRVATKMVEIWEADLLMGSATPSLEAFTKALSGEYELLRLPARVGARPLPQMHIVDMKRELKEGNRSIFSRALIDALERTLKSGRQAILFINRRGFHTFALCRECGFVLNCPHCSIALTYHQTDQSLFCHYCGYRRKMPQNCPSCGSTYIRYFGTGTERVAEQLSRIFPRTPFLRMDTDTTQNKGSHTKILKEFASGRAKILIGTQMIAKGLDIPNVTMVGVVSADSLLYIPDFQAGERSFQLITQVAGRAGRGDAPGEVWVQSYNPEHYLFDCLLEQDYERFYQKEMESRTLLGYPPVKYLVRILVSGLVEKKVEERVDYLRELLKIEIDNHKADEQGIEILGPGPAPLARIKGRSRHHMLLVGESLDELQRLARIIQETAKGMTQEPRIIIDIEPNNLL